MAKFELLRFTVPAQSLALRVSLNFYYVHFNCPKQGLLAYIMHSQVQPAFKSRSVCVAIRHGARLACFFYDAGLPLRVEVLVIGKKRYHFRLGLKNNSHVRWPL